MSKSKLLHVKTISKRAENNLAAFIAGIVFFEKNEMMKIFKGAEI